MIETIDLNTQYVRVHGIGIGSGCSMALINGCAEKGRGYAIYINDNEDPTTKIINLLEQSLSPVISEIYLKFDKQGLELVESITPNPKKVPYILKNEVCNFFINFKKNLSSTIKLTLSYKFK